MKGENQLSANGIFVKNLYFYFRGHIAHVSRFDAGLEKYKWINYE